MKLENFKKFNEEMAPDKLTYYTALITMITSSIGYDLKMETLTNVSGAILTFICFYTLTWAIYTIVIMLLLKKKQQKNEKNKQQIKTEDDK